MYVYASAMRAANSLYTTVEMIGRGNVKMSFACAESRRVPSLSSSPLPSPSLAPVFSVLTHATTTSINTRMKTALMESTDDRTAHLIERYRMCVGVCVLHKSFCHHIRCAFIKFFVHNFNCGNVNTGCTLPHHTPFFPHTPYP